MLGNLLLLSGRRRRIGKKVKKDKRIQMARSWNRKGQNMGGEED